MDLSLIIDRVNWESKDILYSTRVDMGIEVGHFRNIKILPYILIQTVRDLP